MTAEQLLRDIYQQLDEYFNQGFNLSAVREGDRIKIEWNGEVNEIQWVLNGKIVSLNYMWNETNFNPDPITGNSYYIGNKDTVDDISEITVGFGSWSEDKRRIIFDNSETIPAPKKENPEQPNTELSHMVWGWWDMFLPGQTLHDYPFSNALRTYADNVDKALQTEAQYVIPTLGFGKRFTDDLTEYKIRQILRHKGRHFKDQTRDRVPFVIIQDEPKGWTQEQLELVIRLAEEEINPDLLYTYSFSGTHILQERALPQNAKLIHWNHYPFREATYPSDWGYVDSKEDFMDTFDMVVEKVKRNTSDDILMSLTTQTFAHEYRYDDWDGRWQWAIPLPESPLWYAEAMSRHGFIGGLHYLYDADKQDVVAVDMPELMECMKKVYKQIPNKT